jgi:hypothetical protein
VLPQYSVQPGLRFWFRQAKPECSERHGPLVCGRVVQLGEVIKIQRPCNRIFTECPNDLFPLKGRGGASVQVATVRSSQM